MEPRFEPIRKKYNLYILINEPHSDNMKFQWFK